MTEISSKIIKTFFNPTDDDSFESTLNEVSKTKAKDELNERNDEDRKLAVQTLRQWILNQDWLKTPTGMSVYSELPVTPFNYTQISQYVSLCFPYKIRSRFTGTQLLFLV